MKPAIEYILKAYESPKSYRAVIQFVDVCNEKSCTGLVSGDWSNVYQVKHDFFGNGWDDRILFIREELKPSEFNRLSAGLKYAGCTGEELVKFIRENLS